jgi:hypothetical protein
MPLLETKGAGSAQGFGLSLGGEEAVYVEDVFSTYLYTGNGSTQTITNGIDLSTKGGLVWAKSRSDAFAGGLHDSARGVNKQLIPSQTNAEFNNTIFAITYGISAFNNNGFSLNGEYPYDGSCNNSGSTYASWTFRKQPKFFDVVTYTGNDTSRSISHSLGSVPGCIIIKNVSSSGFNWVVYHRSNSATDFLNLNTTAAVATNATYFSSAPTSTVFNIGAGGLVNNGSDTYVAYLFAHDAGGFGLEGLDNVISCGSFTATSNSATVNLGYEPQWILWKQSNAAANWYIYDTMRGWGYSVTNGLYPNLSSAEVNDGGTSSVYFVPTATGFEIKNFVNNGDYIYIAIRRGPMKVPTSGTEVFTPTTYTGTGTARVITGLGFPPDMVMLDSKTFANNFTYDKLRGPNIRLFTNDTAAEVNDANRLTSFNQDGFSLGTLNPNESGVGYANWNFRRAPGFFDEVCYTGTGTENTLISHNLQASPELLIVKQRTLTNGWLTFCSSFSNPVRDYMYLNTTAAKDTAGVNVWGTSSTTFNSFGLGLNANTQTYVAYLFATLAGVSKVGSYTGTGTTLQIDCGFTGGARFVMIKRTDSTGDWYVWDSARGIIAGNDPYLLLNSTAAEVTSTDYIDPYSLGFEISSTAPAAINASGGTFIFLAIA